jgi:hypothetical protein
MLIYSYKIIYIIFDKGILEIIGVTGMSNMIFKLNKMFKSNQNGLIFHYQQIVLFSSILFLLYSLNI